MKFKTFVAWCNQRVCDGRWGALEAIHCIAIISDIRSLPPWRRSKIWKQKYEVEILEKMMQTRS